MDCINVTPTTKQYAKKLLTGISTYAAAVTNKDTFSKFPTKHHDKNPKYIFDERMFPKLKSPHNTPTETTMATTTTATSNSSSSTMAAPAKPSSKTKSKVDLKAIQAELKKSLTTDFTKLINTVMNNFHGEMKASFEKLDSCYDDLSTMVGMLNQQHQYLNSTLEKIQNNLPSALQGGDGHA